MPCKVEFRPFGQVIAAEPGDTILDVAMRAGLSVNHVCGGQCSCTTCHVVIRGGYERLREIDADEHERLQEIGSGRKPTSRLACQTEVTTDLIVEIPI